MLILSADSRLAVGNFQPPTAKQCWQLAAIFVETGSGLLFADADRRTFLFGADGGQLRAFQTQERDAPFRVATSPAGSILASLPDGRMGYFENVRSPPVRRLGRFNAAVWDSELARFMPTGPGPLWPIPDKKFVPLGWFSERSDRCWRGRDLN